MWRKVKPVEEVVPMLVIAPPPRNQSWPFYGKPFALLHGNFSNLDSKASRLEFAANHIKLCRQYLVAHQRDVETLTRDIELLELVYPMLRDGEVKL